MKICSTFALLSSMLVAHSEAKTNIRRLGIGLEPTDPPTATPTEAPTKSPTAPAPTDAPAPAPTDSPAADPTDAPAPAPTDAPVDDAPTASPVACSTIAEIACSTADFSTLCQLVQLFNLEEALSGGTWTVFAPNNAAFAAVGETIATLDPATIQDVLLFHTIQDTAVPSSDLVCDGFVTMSNGKDSQTVCDEEAGDIFQVGEDNLPDALPKIIAFDIPACNGLIHVVDNVMLPDGTLPDSTEAPVEEDPTAAPVEDPTEAPVAAVDPTDAPVEGPPGEPIVVTVEINFDGFSPETGWEIVDASGDVLDSRPIGFYPPLTESATETVDLESGKEYTFTIFDLFGDGLSNPEDGDYSVTQGDTVLVSGGGNFGSEESTEFTTE